jgi:Nif-specific regulatory protein
MGRLPAQDRRGPAVEQNLGEAMSRVVRDSTVLCRLANQLHKHANTETLVCDAIEALVDGIGAHQVVVWLVGTDGRLHAAGRSGEPVDEERDDHLLARLAVEKNKAIRLAQPVMEAGKTIDDTVRKTSSGVGTVMAVPIPGQKSCRGAIECRRVSDDEPFVGSDLDFAVVVAHQAGLALENLEHRERLERANQELRQRLASQRLLAGSSGRMQEVLDQIARVGPTASTVLILGESGTGKELAAHSLHQLSRHSAGPFVAVNCAAFSESLLESELFGHEAGAFTGADRRRVGRFERAHRGTIFLDEVGEMSLACQAKVLRLLEGHPFQRVGGHESIHVDVRLITATHCDLEELVRQGRFREDLFYRLRVIDIHLPPLRQRDDDAVELASLFLEQFHHQVARGPRRLSPEAIEAIRRYPWPGNVRELKNAVERAVVLGGSDELLPADLGLPRQDADGDPLPELMSLRDAERRHIEFVIRKVKGNKTQACRVLGISRATLYAKLEDQDNVMS